MIIKGDQSIQGILTVDRRVVEGLRAVNLDNINSNLALTSRSEKYHRLVATLPATVTLPDATTLSNGYEFIFYTTSDNITLHDNSGTYLQAILPGSMYYVYLMGNSTAAGEWVITRDTSYDIAVGLTENPVSGIRAYFKIIEEYTGSVY